MRVGTSQLQTQTPVGLTVSGQPIQTTRPKTQVGRIIPDPPIQRLKPQSLYRPMETIGPTKV